MEELSKCPVCGEDVTLETEERGYADIEDNGYGDGVQIWHTSCMKCGIGLGWAFSEDDAIKDNNNSCGHIAHHLAPRADLDRVTAERDAAVSLVEKQAKRISTLDSLILIKACKGCEGVAEALGIGHMMNPIPVIKERLAERDAAVAELERLQKERDALKGFVEHVRDCGSGYK